MTTLNVPRYIDTGDLLLDPLCEADADELFEAVLGDAAATAWLPFRTHTCVEESRLYARSASLAWVRDTYYLWVMRHKANGHLVGVLGMWPTLPRVEIGIMTTFRPGRLHRRSVRAAVYKIIEWTLQQPEVFRLQALCAAESPTKGMLRKLGFKFEARLANWESRPNLGLVTSDSLVFAITRDQPLSQHNQKSLFQLLEHQNGN